MGKNKRKAIKDEYLSDENDINDEKIKKKKKHKLEPIDDGNSNANEIDNNVENSPISPDNKNVDVNNSDLILEEDIETKWTQADLQTLLTNIDQCLPKNDLGKYSTTLEKGIDWEEVKFDDHDAQECKQCALRIVKKVRRYRTLSEILVDARSWALSPWKSLTTHRVVHPDLPKKPMSAYLRYFQEKRLKLQSRNPSWSITELSKIAAEKYNQLSDRKKAKYKSAYEMEMIDYRQKMEQFKQEHPDLYKKRLRKKPTSQVGPERPRTPYQLYKENRLKKTADPQQREESKIREAWNNISDKRRYKFIKKSIKDEERYKNELEEFIQNYPNFEPPKLKPLLNKSETELKYKLEGMPEKPPNSGYMLFSQMMLKEVKDVPSKEKMVVIAKRWKEMTDEERSKFNQDAHLMVGKYIIDFDEYLQTLPEDEKEKVLTEQKFRMPSEKKIRDKINSDKNEKDLIDNTALIAYQMEEMNRLQTEHPKVAKSEIMAKINEQWKQMSIEQKSKYTELATSIQDFIPRPLNRKTKSKTKTNPTNSLNSRTSHSEGTTTKPIKFKNAKEEEFFKQTGLKKPRPNGFVIFSHEILTTKNDIATRSRLGYASELWKTMDEEVKQRYNRLARKKFLHYHRLLSQFEQTGELPSEEDRKLIESFSIIDKCEIDDYDDDYIDGRSSLDIKDTHKISPSKKRNSSALNNHNHLKYDGDSNSSSVDFSSTLPLECILTKPTEIKNEPNMVVENHDNLGKRQKRVAPNILSKPSSSKKKSWTNIMYNEASSSSSASVDFSD